MLRQHYEIKVYGDGNVSALLTKLKSVGTVIKYLYISREGAHFHTDRKGIGQIRRYRRRYGLKMTITPKKNSSDVGAFFNSYRYFIVFIIPLIGSFFLWTVEIESDVPEVIDRIENKLASSSIVPFRPLKLIPDEGEIRRILMQDDPSLSWVRFVRSGSSLTVIPMLSPSLDIMEEEKGPPSDLIASTGGVITRFELTQGERVGHVHKTVKKGDVLATGLLEQGDKKIVIGAEGAVFADYWLEYAFQLPREIRYTIQGDEKVEFAFSWPTKKQLEKMDPKDFKTFFSYFVKAEHPIQVITEKLILEEGMEQTVLVPLLKQKLLSEREATLIIKEEKVLHVTFDNDKVNGTILFLVNDNIAVKRPITQGD